MSQVHEVRDGELDAEGLLRGFFRAELPHPWPPFRGPVEVTTPKSHRSLGIQHSHVGLAASVLFLVAGLGAGSFMLRSDGQANAEGGILPSAGKPIAPGKLFKDPPGTSPSVAPSKPISIDEDPPLSLALPPRL